MDKLAPIGKKTTRNLLEYSLPLIDALIRCTNLGFSYREIAVYLNSLKMTTHIGKSWDVDAIKNLFRGLRNPEYQNKLRVAMLQLISSGYLTLSNAAKLMKKGR